MSASSSAAQPPASPPRPQASPQLPDPVAVLHTLRRVSAAAQPPWLHAEIAGRMAPRLALIRHQPELLIDWWGQRGASADLLRQACPRARRLVFEPDARWAEQSRLAALRPWFDPRRWQARSGEVLSDPEALPSGAADLVWANMMLHAVADPPALLARWLRTLRVGGFVMFSCLGPGTLRELRSVYRQQGWGEPAHGFVDMHDLGDMLVHAGFADPVMDQEVLTLRWNDLASMQAELRSLGGNAAAGRFQGLRTPAWHDRLAKALEDLRGPDGRLGLSFEIVFGHAFKGTPRATVGPETVIALQDMRGMIGRGEH